MRRRAVGFLSMAVPSLVMALAAAGCGSSTSATQPDEAPAAPRVGAAVIDGTIVNGFAASSTGGIRALAAAETYTVSVVGTPLSGSVDEQGHFALAGVPAGSVTLHFEGPGMNARLQVSGLVDHQVMSIEVQVSGTNAQMTSTPQCVPTKEVKFRGLLDSAAGTKLVVGGRNVDASQVQQVWRGNRRMQLSDLQVGEKVEVWGMLRGDGVVVAGEIVALTRGGATGTQTFVTFRGKVESIWFSQKDLHLDCTYPVLVIAGRKVKTDGSTKMKQPDGSALDPARIQVGDQAYVEGWQKPEGHVLATRLVVAVH